jgi:hypothetical protein
LDGAAVEEIDRSPGALATDAIFDKGSPEGIEGNSTTRVLVLRGDLDR